MYHDLRKYYSYFIMQDFAKFGHDISVMPNNMEKYMVFMIEKKPAKLG